MRISTTGSGWRFAALLVTMGLCLAPEARAAESAAQQAKAILKAAGVTGGLIVHVGCGDAKLTAALRANPHFVVHGLDADVTEARRNIRAAGVYGPVSADRWGGGALPYVDNLVRLLVVTGNARRIARKEILRVLCPGGVAMVGPSTGLRASTKIVKPWPDEIDEWPQHFHGADNNAVSRDSVVGPPRHYQWIATPQWSRSHLCLPSINSLVSARGRLFSIEDQASAEHPALPGKFALVCRDAFNGIVLWNKRLPDWQPINIYIKFTPAQLQRQLAVIGDTVYCTLGLNAPITALDAATGTVIKTYEGTERTQEFAYDQGVLYVVSGDPYDTVGIGKTSGTIGSSAFPVETYGPKIPKLADPKSTILAIDAESGRTLWRKSGDDTRAYQGTSLAVRGASAVYCAGDSLICLDRKTGTQRWRVPVGVGKGMDAAVKKRGGGTGRPGLSVSLVLSDDAVYVADATLAAFSLKDGKKLWTGKTKLNHFKGPDLFLAAGALWTANRYAYDPKTGREIRTLSQKMTGPMGHDRCYRNRITERWYINSVTGGSDFLALDGSGEFPNPWVRSTCGIGALPCNGLYYAGPPACSCCNSVQLNAFNALAPAAGLKSSAQKIPVKVNPRIEKGPAYSEISNLKSETSDSDWPTYRAEPGRGGCTKAAVGAALKPKWQTKLSTRASAPVIAAGKVFIADVDAHAVRALNADDGRVAWTYTAGGRVDSPPTYHRGSILFGSHDGWVYCLRAADGELAWRFKALPDGLICAYEQVESTWPVSGSILVRENIAYFAAGRNTFTDGGVFLFGLDPQTGRVIHQRRLYGPYGEDGYPIIASKVAGGFALWGNKGDVLLADSRHLYMRHQAFTPDLTPVDHTELTEPHLIASHGLTEAIPHHRSFWTIDTTIRYDIPTGGSAVHGDILVRDGAQYYEVRGYRPSRTASFDPRGGGYTLFAGDLSKPASPAPARPKPTPAKGKKRRAAKKPRKPRVGPRASQRWSVKIPLTGKAMAKAGDVVFVAGTPVAFPKGDLAKAYEGRMGGVLWAVSAKDGRKLAEYTLDAPPAWDSMAATTGRLVLCTTDGQVRCFEGKALQRKGGLAR